MWCFTPTRSNRSTNGPEPDGAVLPNAIFAGLSPTSFVYLLETALPSGNTPSDQPALAPSEERYTDQFIPTDMEATYV